MCAALIVGCKENSKEIEALRKELGELKVKANQDQQSQKLQSEISRMREGVLEGSVFIVTKARENVKMGLVTVSLFDSTHARMAVQKVRTDLRRRSDEIAAQAKPLFADVETAREKYKAVELEYKAAREAAAVAKENLIKQFNAIPGRSRLNHFDLSNPEYRESDDAQTIERKKAVYAEYRSKVDSAEDTRKGIALKGRAEYDKFHPLYLAYNSLTKSQRDLIKSYEQLCFAALGSPVSAVQTDADGKFKLMTPRSGEFVLSASASRDVGSSSETYFWIITHSLDGKDHSQILLSNDNKTDAYGATSIVERSGIEESPYAKYEYEVGMW